MINPIITLKDGTIEYIESFDDVKRVVEEHLGEAFAEKLDTLHSEICDDCPFYNAF